MDGVRWRRVDVLWREMKQGSVALPTWVTLGACSGPSGFDGG